MPVVTKIPLVWLMLEWVLEACPSQSQSKTLNCRDTIKWVSSNSLIISVFKRLKLRTTLHWWTAKQSTKLACKQISSLKTLKTAFSSNNYNRRLSSQKKICKKSNSNSWLSTSKKCKGSKSMIWKRASPQLLASQLNNFHSTNQLNITPLLV